MGHISVFDGLTSIDDLGFRNSGLDCGLALLGGTHSGIGCGRLVGAIWQSATVWCQK
jgi:hypothetical protein